MEFNVSLGLRHRFIKNIQEVLCQGFFEFQIIRFQGAVIVIRILPLLEPLPKPVGDQDAVTNFREAFLPCGILCTRKANVNRRRSDFFGVGEILCKGIVQVVPYSTERCQVG